MNPSPGLPFLVTSTVPSLPVPPPALFAEAELADLTREAHDRFALDLPAFNAVEFVSPPPRDTSIGPVHVAAWNAERLKHAAASAALVRESGADILLLTEADCGMARSGNGHTVADLAAALGMGYAYGVEFLEFGLGDEFEREAHRGERNLVGFHGNAIVSRLPMAAPVLIRLDDGAVWWLEPRDGQRRLGFRMAIATEIVTRSGPLVVVVAHLESKSDAADRARQMIRLIDAIDRRYAGKPVLIGGDMNTKSLDDDAARTLSSPEAEEPLFAALRGVGFGWQGANDGAATVRATNGRPHPPMRRLDWFFTRGLDASRARTIEAVDAEGNALSDHEMIAADFRII